MTMKLSLDEESRLIEMAWEDRTPFEAIEHQFNLNEHQLISFMRKSLKANSFKLWRKRTHGRQTKHLGFRSSEVSRSHCPTQYKQR